MQELKSAGQAQRFLAAYALITQHFRSRRHVWSASVCHQQMGRFHLWPRPSEGRELDKWGGSFDTAGGMMIPDKSASTDYPVHELLAARWSPYAFQDRAVPDADLRSLFEAARWAASSFNEQPWTYIVATKEHPDQFQQLLSCLIEFNQVWAKAAPVLALGIVSLSFARDGQANRAAVHDLGLAAGNLLVEATARGIFVHQMLGILPEKARQIFAIPDGYEAWTGLAIGYRGDPAQLPDVLQERERRPRQRKPLHQFIFSGRWGHPSPFVLKR